MPAATEVPAAHRLLLTAAEYAFLVVKSGFDLPPEWSPAPDITTGAEAEALLDRGVLRGSGDLTTVHPSVEANLRVLAAPRIMIDTTATAPRIAIAPSPPIAATTAIASYVSNPSTLPADMRNAPRANRYCSPTTTTRPTRRPGVNSLRPTP